MECTHGEADFTEMTLTFSAITVLTLWFRHWRCRLIYFPYFSLYVYVFRLRRCRLIPLLCLTACMYSASGDDDWSLPFYLLSYILRYAILMLLHVVIPLSYPCKIILFIVSAIICTLLWWLMCYFLMIILNTAPRILGSSQLVSELWLTLVPGSNTLNTSSE